MLGIEFDASAVPCDPSVQYDDAVPELLYDHLPTDRLPTPSVQGVRDRWQDTLPGDLLGCGSAGQTWCRENYVYVPNSAGHTPLASDPLFLFLHGAGNYPEQHEHILSIAAFAGYRAVGLSWDAWSYDSVPAAFGGQETSTRARQCATFLDHDLLPATPPVLEEWPVCDSGDTCQHDMAVEMLTGQHIDDAISPYDAHPMRSITHRLGLLLNDLHLEDVSDGTNDYQWDSYCSIDAGETKIHWNDVVVGGFSMGATVAGFISYTEGAHGLLLLDGGSDVCREPNAPATDFRVEGFYGDYDPPCGGSCDNALGGWHSNFSAGQAAIALPGLLAPLGLYPDGNGDFVDIDTYGVLDFDTAPSNMFHTDQGVPNPYGPHSSMAVDDAMPSTYAGGPAVDPPDFSNELYLFDTYLEAMCTLF